MRLIKEMFSVHGKISLPGVMGVFLILLSLGLALATPWIKGYDYIWPHLMYAGLAAIGAQTVEVGINKWQNSSPKS